MTFLLNPEGSVQKSIYVVCSKIPCPLLVTCLAVCTLYDFMYVTVTQTPQ